MTERNDNQSSLTSWRSIAITAAGMVAVIGLALLFIEQLSLRAAIRGGIFAIGGMVFSRFLLRWWVGRRRGN